MLLHCQIDSCYYQIYLAASEYGFEDELGWGDASDEQCFTSGQGYIAVTVDWEGIDGEISVYIQDFTPDEKFHYKGSAVILSPSKTFELGEPTSPGAGIKLYSNSESVSIKLFTDGKELPKEIVLMIDNTELTRDR